MNVSSVPASSLASSVAAPTTAATGQPKDTKPVGQAQQEPTETKPVKAALPPKVGQVIDISA